MQKTASYSSHFTAFFIWSLKIDKNVHTITQCYHSLPDVVKREGKMTGCTLGCHLVFVRNRVWSTSWTPRGLKRALELSGWFCLWGVCGIIQSNSAVWSANICSTRSRAFIFRAVPLRGPPLIGSHTDECFYLNCYLNWLSDTLKWGMLLHW